MLIKQHKDSTNQYDILIIGGGPGGYVSAIKAAQLGAKVAVFEADNVGGTCLNWGCIPTKSLLNNAHNWYQMQSKDIFTSDNQMQHIKLSMEKLVRESRAAVHKLTSGVSSLLKANNVDLYNAKATIVQPSTVQANHQTYTAPNIIIATGAHSREHPILKTDGQNILYAKHAMMLQEIPDSIAIVGAGVIGIEFASLFNALGSKVYLIEFADKIMSYMDDDIIQAMHAKLKQRGVEIITNASVTSYKTNSQNIQLDIASKGKSQSITVDKCLISIGLTGNVYDLGLQNTKVQINKNMQVITNEYSETDEPGIYAIGDVNSNGPWLAHRASEEGIRCVEKILGHHTQPLNLNNIPGCVYSMPQIGCIGLTEQEALQKNLNIIVRKFPLSANGKALTKYDDGFIKLIVDSDIGSILGAHIISNEATELISQPGIMMDLEAVCSEISYVFPHPTLSEAISEAILSINNKAIHIVNKR